MGTRVAQNNQGAGKEMPGKFSMKNHVRQLTIECLKSFESNPDQKPNFEGKNCDFDLSERTGVNSLERPIILSDGIEDIKDDDKSNEFGTCMTQDPADALDSGVEVIRTLSSNESNSDRYTPAQSCGSSLLSCYSELEGDRISECGSENSKDGKTKMKATSSIADESKRAASAVTKTDRSRVSSRRVSEKDLSECCSDNSSISESQNVSRPNRLSDNLNRMVSSRLIDKKSEGKTQSTRRVASNTRVSSRDKSGVRSHSSARVGSAAVERAGIKSRPSKPPHSSSTCKMDDGRWPSAVQKNENRRNAHGNEAVKKVSNVMSSSVASANLMTSSCNGKNLIGETKSNALDKYGTLPRRPKRKSLENTGEGVMNQSLTLVRSSSVSREPSLNRAATLRRQQSREKEQGNLANGKSLPPYPKAKKSTGKTVIYHEISIQTSVTGEDITNILAGMAAPDPIVTRAVEKANKAVQSEGREKLKDMEECYAKQCQELENEKKENERLKKERHDILMRICKMLGYTDLRGGSGECELSELEQHLQAVGLTVIKQREELSELRHFKNIMQRDLEKSFAAQKTLLQQQQDIEAEYFELQEFLQAEKTALSESLNDTEAEVEKLRKEVSRKEELLQRQQEECKHLVRICEQRRQENLSLEAKLYGLEQRSRDVIVQQGAAVSGAAVALSGLGARLDTLVEQLAISCNISEKDLEDVIYHNEVYSQGQSADNSPDETAPKRVFGNDGDSPKKSISFLNAIMGALRSATQSPIAAGKKNSLAHSQNDHSDALSLLEADSDHCLIVEENASSASNYTDCVSCSSRGELIKYDICDDTITLVSNGEYETDLSRSDSIQNLSAAILARQEIEKIERNLSPDLIIPTEVNSLVDKVIDVDNLLTKLLKVLRIIQLENDVSLEQLEDQRLDLSEKLHQEQLCRQKMEEHLQQLQYELKDARSQLSLRIVQLEQAKMMLNKDARNVVSDSQRQYAAIHNAIGTLQSIQDVVNQCPPLAKLQQDLQDCNNRSTCGDDLNANTAANGNLNKTIVKEVKRNCSVLTTAV